MVATQGGVEKAYFSPDTDLFIVCGLPLALQNPGLCSVFRLNQKDPGPFANWDLSYSRSRSRSGQQDDLERFARLVAKQRILDTARHDGPYDPSPGEVVATQASEILNISPADVLRDPKLRPIYVHLGLRYHD